jgi:hypothetical protein
MIYLRDSGPRKQPNADSYVGIDFKKIIVHLGTQLILEHGHIGYKTLGLFFEIGQHERTKRAD